MGSRLSQTQQDLDERSNDVQNLKSRITELESRPVPAAVATVAAKPADEDGDGWNEDFTGFGSDDVVVPSEEPSEAAEIRETAEVTAAKAELNLAREELESLKHRLVATEQERDQLSTLVSSLQSQINQPAAAIDAVEGSDGWNENFDGFGPEEKVDRSVFDQVQVELEQARTEIQVLAGKLQESEAENEIQISRVSTLTQQVETLRVKTAEAGDEDGDGWKEDFDPFGPEEKVDKSLLDAVKSELDQARVEIETLRSSLHQSENRKRELEAAMVDSLSSKIPQIEAQVQEGANEGWDDFEAFAEPTVDAEAVKVELADARAEIELLRSKLDAVEGEKTELVSSLRSQIEALEGSGSAQKDSQGGWDEDFDTFGDEKIDVEAIKLELNQARAEIESLRSSLVTVEKEKREQTEATSALKNKIAALELQLEESVAGTGDANNGWNDDFEGFGSGEPEASPGVAELQQKLDDSLRQLSDKENEAAELARAVAALQERASQLESELETKDRDHEEAVLEVRQELEEEREKVAEHEAAFVALNDQGPMI